MYSKTDIKNNTRSEGFGKISYRLKRNNGRISDLVSARMRNRCNIVQAKPTEIRNIGILLPRTFATKKSRQLQH